MVEFLAGLVIGMLIIGYTGVRQHNKNRRTFIGSLKDRGMSDEEVADVMCPLEAGRNTLKKGW